MWLRICGGPIIWDQGIKKIQAFVSTEICRSHCHNTTKLVKDESVFLINGYSAHKYRWRPGKI